MTYLLSPLRLCGARLLPGITSLCRNGCEAELVKDLWASGRFATFTQVTARGQKVRKKFQGLGKKFMKSINALTEKIDVSAAAPFSSSPEC